MKLKKEKETREAAALLKGPRISNKNKKKHTIHWLLITTVEAQEPASTGVNEEQPASNNANVPLPPPPPVPELVLVGEEEDEEASEEPWNLQPHEGDVVVKVRIGS